MTEEKSIINTIDLNRSSLIEASAGTGKTFTVSYLVLRLLLGKPSVGSDSALLSRDEPLDIENILVVTFTNAAAAELRARILERIHASRVGFEKMLNAENEEKREEVISTFEDPLKLITRDYLFDSGDKTFRKDKTSLYIRLLGQAERSIDEASISTIHSFCNRALNKIYSFEAGRAFNVELSQDIQKQEQEAGLAVFRELFYENSADLDLDVFSELFRCESPDDLKKYIEALMAVKIISGNSGYYGFCVNQNSLTADERKEGGNCLPKTPLLRIKELVDRKSRLDSNLYSKAENYVKEVLGIFEEFPYFNPYGTEGSFFDAKKKVSFNSKSAPVIKEVFYDENYSLKDSCEVLKNIRHLTGLGTNKGGKVQLAARIRSAEGLEHKDEFEEATANLFELYKLVQEEAFTVETIEKELKILVSILIIRRTDEICKRDNVISNNEVLRQLAQSLRDKKRGDALASVLRKHYPVALIDEFQDTDPVQFAVFEKMYMNEDARNDSCVCYLIGDPKQSIYAFRGSDINSYNKAKELVKNLSPGKETVYTLDINYRAATNVINGVNSVFLNGSGYMCDPFGSSIPFESVSPPKKEGFKDKFNFVFNEELSEDDEADKHPVSNYVTTVFPDNNTKKKKSSENEKNNSVLSSDYKKTVAMAVTYDVMKALSDGVIIEKGITKRKVRPGDIAILVSKGSESEAIQNELKSKGLQSVYFSEKGSVLTTVTSSGFIKKTSPSKEAVSLVYFMEAMCNSRDVSKISRLLGSDLFSLTQKEFKECTTAEMIDLEIQNISLCALKWEQFGFITAFNYYVRQHDLILKIMNREEGERSLTNYFQIAELIQSKKTQLPTPSAQLTWFKNELENDNGELSKDVTKKRLESEKDLIKIYTIHMSKGLQYPLVFLPYLFGAHPEEELGKDVSVYYDPFVFVDKEKGHMCLTTKDCSVLDEQGNPVDISVLKSNASEAEKVRLLYVAITRAQAANFIYLNDFVKISSYIDDALRVIVKPNNPEDPLKAFSDEKLFKHQRINFDDGLYSQKNLSDDSHYPKLSLEDENLQQLNGSDAKVNTLDEECIDRSFTVTSYSGITAGSHNDIFHNFNDDSEKRGENISQDPSVNSDRSSLEPRFVYTKSAKAGTFLHKVFEELLSLPYENRDSEEHLVEAVKKLQRFDYAHTLTSLERASIEPVKAISRWFMSVLNTPLVPIGSNGEHLRLNDLTPYSCARELDYFLPCSHFKKELFNEILKKYFSDEMAKIKEYFGEFEIPSLPAIKCDFKGFMNGSLDLVGQYQTKDGPKFYMMDYKSNFLGNSTADYSVSRIVRSIFESRYDVQILFYSLALHRYLKMSFAKYKGDKDSYEKYFGGVMYLYLRGMSDSQENFGNGVFYTKVSWELIEKLEQLFESWSEE